MCNFSSEIVSIENKDRDYSIMKERYAVRSIFCEKNLFEVVPIVGPKDNSRGGKLSF